MAFRFQMVKDNGTIKPIERRTTSYAPANTKKSLIFEKRYQYGATQNETIYMGKRKQQD